MRSANPPLCYIKHVNMEENQTLLGSINSFKTAVYEESGNRGQLIPFIEELEAAVEAKNYIEALRLTDEIEEFMDLELMSS